MFKIRLKRRLRVHLDGFKIKKMLQEEKIAKSSLNATLVAVFVICIAGVFCFDKMEKTTAETERITKLNIERNESETKLLLAKEGKIAPEYRPIVLSSRSVSANTAYQPSTTRYTEVQVSVQISCNLSLSGGAAGNWVIQTCSTSGGTYTTLQSITSSNTGSLTIGLNTTQISAGILVAVIQPGFYYKIVSTSTTGTATFSILNSAIETQL